MKAVRPVIASNGVPYPQMKSVGSHSTSGREKEGKKTRTGWFLVVNEKEGRRGRGILFFWTAVSLGFRCPQLVPELNVGIRSI